MFTIIQIQITNVYMFTFNSYIYTSWGRIRLINTIKLQRYSDEKL